MINVSYTSVDDLMKDLKQRLAPEVKSSSGVFDNMDAVIRAKRNEFGDIHNKLYESEAPIPARPFIRPAIEGKKTIKTYLQKMAEHFVSNIESVDTDDLLVVLSESVTDKIKLNILNKKSPSNSTYTINQKGFNDPLIETGLMYDNVDWRPGS